MSYDVGLPSPLAIGEQLRIERRDGTIVRAWVESIKTTYAVGVGPTHIIGVIEENGGRTFWTPKFLKAMNAIASAEKGVEEARKLVSSAAKKLRGAWVDQSPYELKEEFLLELLNTTSDFEAAEYTESLARAALRDLYAKQH